MPPEALNSVVSFSMRAGFGKKCGFRGCEENTKRVCVIFPQASLLSWNKNNREHFLLPTRADPFVN